MLVFVVFFLCLTLAGSFIIHYITYQRLIDLEERYLEDRFDLIWEDESNY